MALFTVENAVEMGKRSAQARQLARERPLVLPTAPVDALPDPFCDALASACGEALKELREMINAHKPGHAAQLARALRDLRETWHLATGKPKPGQLKPDAQATRRPAMPRVYPSVYGPGPDEAKPSSSNS